MNSLSTVQMKQSLDALEDRKDSIPKPYVMFLSKSEVTIVLWRDTWIYHTFEGHICISRCGKNAQEIEEFKLDGPPADDGWVYYIKVCRHTEDEGLWVSKEEAIILRNALDSAYAKYYE